MALACKVKHLAGGQIPLSAPCKLSKNTLGRFVQIARCALAMVKHLELKNQSGRGCYVMSAGKSVEMIRREME